jgi:hypothetical protein
MTSRPWVGASLATKTLHKKRPGLIPILDNQAIFGACMNPLWPQKRSLMDTIKAVPRIKEALDWIATDLARAENTAVCHLNSPRGRIKLSRVGPRSAAGRPVFFGHPQGGRGRRL